jgi:hypothetical protein
MASLTNRSLARMLCTFVQFNGIVADGKKKGTAAPSNTTEDSFEKAGKVFTEIIEGLNGKIMKFRIRTTI